MATSDMRFCLGNSDIELTAILHTDVQKKFHMQPQSVFQDLVRYIYIYVYICVWYTLHFFIIDFSSTIYD